MNGELNRQLLLDYFIGGRVNGARDRFISFVQLSEIRRRWPSHRLCPLCNIEWPSITIRSKERRFIFRACDGKRFDLCAPRWQHDWQLALAMKRDPRLEMSYSKADLSDAMRSRTHTPSVR